MTDTDDNMTQGPVDSQQGSEFSANEATPEALLRVSSAVEKRMGQPQQGEMPFAVVQGEALTELPRTCTFRPGRLKSSLRPLRAHSIYCFI